MFSSEKCKKAINYKVYLREKKKEEEEEEVEIIEE